MRYIIRMPQMGMEMDQGEVVSWEAAEGDAVAEDDILVVVESEKATNEVEVREDGTLRRILVVHDTKAVPAVGRSRGVRGDRLTVV